MESKNDGLTAETFRERLETNSAPTFLTLISIIQGVALSFLVTNTEKVLNTVKPETRVELCELLALPAFSFVIIVAVFFLYSYFVNIDWRPPSFWEALIPFSIGLAEIIATFYFHDPAKWYGAMCGLFIASIFGLYNTLRGLKKDDFSQGSLPNAYILAVKETKLNIVIVAIMALVSGMAPFLRKPEGTDFGTYDWVFMGILFAICIALLSKSQYWFLRELYQDAKIRK